MDSQEEIRERCALVVEQIADRVRRDEVSALLLVVQDKREEDIEILCSHTILAVSVHLLSRALQKLAATMIARHYRSNLNPKPQEPLDE